MARATPDRTDPVAASFDALTRRPSVPTGVDAAAPRAVREAPGLALPKGGGALRTLGEKLGAVSMQGTCSFSVPLPLPASRDDQHPALALTYSTSAGHSAFGLGWDVPTGSVRRKTDRGLPRYDDTDRFILGGDDLVVVESSTIAAPFGGTGAPTLRTVYRPRVEGAHARIERHITPATDETFWAVFNANNVLTLYGRSPESRISDPANEHRVFEWLITDVFDDLGNHVHYSYAADDSAGIEFALLSENHRRGQPAANRYLKEVAYSVREPVADRCASAVLRHDDPAWRDAFCFLVVFDYGDHPGSKRTADVLWPPRPDRFSTRRPGFEVRTQRRCERVLIFHQFPDELQESATLVSETVLSYASAPALSLVSKVTHRGHGAVGDPVELAPLTFTYQDWNLQHGLHELPLESLDGLPSGVLPPVRFVDLDGLGAAGMLVEQAGTWFYKSNLGDGRFAAPTPVQQRPNTAPGEAPALGNLFGDHRTTLLTLEGGSRCYAVRDGSTGQWQASRPFPRQPTLGDADPGVLQLDLTGDGLPDLVRMLGASLEWYPFLGEEGWEAARQVALHPDDRFGPAVVWRDERASIQVADMTGDGLTDIVRVCNGAIDYWPNMGFGRFGARISMDGAPVVTDDQSFQSSRVRLGDVDGTGTADLLYAGAEGIRCWPNQLGNGFGAPLVVSDAVVGDTAQLVGLSDLLGTGTLCAMLSSGLPGDADRSLTYVDLMPDGKPYLLCAIDNGNGSTTKLSYSTSTVMALRDRRAGRPWSTSLPLVVHVVAGITRTDATTGLRTVSSHRYRDGYFDIADREFRGFGYVEESDAESTETAQLPPVVTATWYHTGAPGQRLPRRLVSDLLDPAEQPAQAHELRRALRGQVLRRAVYALDGTPQSRYPYEVVEHSWHARLLGPATGQPDAGGYWVTAVDPREELTLHLERQALWPDHELPDPVYVAGLGPAPTAAAEPARLTHQVAVEVNEFGHVTRSCNIAYGRGDPAARPRQTRSWATVQASQTGNLLDQTGRYRIGVPIEERTFEVLAVATPPAGTVFSFAQVVGLATAPVVPHATQTSAAPALRVLSTTLHRYWDDPGRTELPDGQFGTRALGRRSVTAAMTAEQLALITGGLAADQLISEGHYLRFPDAGGADLLWAPSAVVQYDAASFCLPVAYVDQAGLGTFVSYDNHRLAITSTAIGPALKAATDDRFAAAASPAPWNVTSAQHDYRVLQPSRVVDLHGATDIAEYDALGTLRRSRRQGVAGEGVPAGQWDLEVELDRLSWVNPVAGVRRPNWVRERKREQVAAPTGWQSEIRYYDGQGAVLQHKVSADETVVAGAGNGAQARWLAMGDTVYDGKARPIRRYEPYFAADDRFETDAHVTRSGLANSLGYDPIGRVVRIDFADGTVARVEQGIWAARTWDQNDAVRESRWYGEQLLAGPGPTASAQASAAHAATPAVAHADALGRAVELVESNAGVLLTTAISYDIEGRALRVTDPRGIAVLDRTYDLLGRLLVAGSVDAGERRSVSDAAGRVLRSWRGCAAWTATAADFDVRIREVRDAYGRTTASWIIDRTTGDNSERCRHVAVYGDDDPGWARPRYLLGRSCQIFDGAGVEQMLRCDLRGGVLETARQFTSTVGVMPEWSAVAAASGIDRRGTAGGVLDLETFNASSAFDLLGRTTVTTAADGSTIGFSYGRGGMVSRVDLTPAGEASRSVVRSVEYDTHQRPARILHGGTAGVVSDTVNEYSPHNGRLLRTTVTAGAGGVLQDVTYRYDAIGNILEISDAAQPTRFFKNAVVASTRSYTYDDLSQLISAEGRELAGLVHTGVDSSVLPAVQPVPGPADLQAVVRYVEDYTYDPAGNLTVVKHRQQVAGGAVWRREVTVAGGSNQLTGSVVQPDGGAAHTEPAAFDRRGNATALGHLVLAPSWNDQPESVTAHGNVTEHLAYAHDGNRVRRTALAANGQVLEDRRYVGSCTFTVGTSAADGESAKDVTVQLTGRTSVVYERSAAGSGRTRLQICDHLGTPVVELSDLGAVLTYEEYHPWGTVAYHAASESTLRAKRYRFSGCERDRSGLQLHGLRYYAAWLGRWCTPDPIGLRSGDTNLYRYCVNNPVMHRDREGLEPTPAGPLNYIDTLAANYGVPKIRKSALPIPRILGDTGEYNKITRLLRANYDSTASRLGRLTHGRLDEAEHFFAKGIKVFFPKYEYGKAPALVIERALSVLKTHRPGGDNALTAAAKKGAIKTEEFMARSAGNFTRSIGDHWAQLGEGGAWLSQRLRGAEALKTASTQFLKDGLKATTHLVEPIGKVVITGLPTEKAAVKAVAPKLAGKAGSKVPLLGIATAIPLVVNDIKNKDWGNAYLDALGPVPVAGWVAGGAQVILSSETAKLAIGTTIVEKLVGANKSDIDLLEKMTVSDVVKGAAGGIYHGIFGK